MWFRNLLRFWTGWKTRRSQRRNTGKRAKPASRWSRSLLFLEPLEDRAVPATVDINSATFTADMNAAITTANGTAAADARALRPRLVQARVRRRRAGSAGQPRLV